MTGYSRYYMATRLFKSSELLLPSLSLFFIYPFTISLHLLWQKRLKWMSYGCLKKAALCGQSVRKHRPIHNNFLCDFFLFHAVTRLTWGIGKWVAYWMWRGCSYSWGKAGSMPFSLQLALLSCSGADFSGEGLPLDSQCIGGENICRGKMRQKWFHSRIHGDSKSGNMQHLS